MVEQSANSFDDNLNHKDSLLNYFNSVGVEVTADSIVSGVFGSNSNANGIQFGINKTTDKSFLQSRNFKTGTTGWQIDGDGNVEFASGVFRGSITGATITATTITGGTFQTSALTTVDRVIISGTNNDVEFWNSDNTLSASISTDYNPINYLSGISIDAGGGTYLNLYGKSNMGYSVLGANPDSDNDGSIVVVWDANDYTTLRLSLLSTIGGVAKDLPIAADLIPYSAGYDLGSATTKWDNIFAGIKVGLTPTASPPATVAEGDIYADTDHHLYYYNGTTWKQLDN
jgi:hypothetical protein